MSSAAILSIKPVYTNQILAGTKTIELRRSAMGLAIRDVVLVYASAPEQQLSCWFRVKDIETLPVAQMWTRYEKRLGICREDYEAYFGDAESATGLHVGEVHRIKPVPLSEIQRVVPGFVPPQGVIWLRDEFGKYERLLPNLTDPLPAEVFPQRTFDLMSARGRAG